MKTIVWIGRLLGRFFALIIRPFMDFYYNYGLTRATVLSYVLFVNLILFVYMAMIIGVTMTIGPLVAPSNMRRFLELHFLWPVPEKIWLKKAPEGFPIPIGDIVNQYEYNAALGEYCAKNNITPQELEGRVERVKFSITKSLGDEIYNAIRAFYSHKDSSDIQPLGAGFFVGLAIAYFALLLSIKTNLAESVSPIIWGNLPLENRRSEIMKILWRLPDTNLIKTRIYLFFMLPILLTFIVTIMSAGHAFVDKMMDSYSTGNILVTAFVSWLMTTTLFATLYELHVSGISKKNALLGAMIAAALWLGGRWFFTTYGAVSLYRNLRNFALIPMCLTWFYYFCTVFLFGLYVADTLQNPNLTPTTRAWVMRDIIWNNRYATLTPWIRLNFLYRLALNRYEEYRPPFICIKYEEDAAVEIARRSNLHHSFVRECILEMITRHRKVFLVEKEGNRQYCKLKCPPEEVEVTELLTDEQEIHQILSEMPDYLFGHFIIQTYGTRWQAKTLLLSQVYTMYKEFFAKKQQENIMSSKIE